MTTKRALFVTTIAIASMMTIGVSPAPARDVTPRPNSAAKLPAQSVTSQDRMKQLAEVLLDTTDPYSAVGRALIRRHGFQLVSESGPATVWATDNSFVNLPRPTVVYDLHTNRYFASGSYTWNSYKDNFDGPDVCLVVVECERSIGGTDGLGLRFNKQVTNKAVSATFYGAPSPVIDHFSQFSLSNPAANNSSGVTYEVQDKIYTGAAFGRDGHRDYNIWRGVVSMEIGQLPCGKSVQLYSLYSHTWSSTSINGFGVSVDGFSISWSESTHHWQAASQSGTYQRC